MSLTTNAKLALLADLQKRTEQVETYQDTLFFSLNRAAQESQQQSTTGKPLAE